MTAGVDDVRGHTWWCAAHHKKSYATRKTARRAIRILCESRMRAYRCTALGDRWHIGHTPPALLYGERTADEIYGEEATNG